MLLNFRLPYMTSFHEGSKEIPSKNSALCNPLTLKKQLKGKKVMEREHKSP